ncbi:aminoglycoside phosphotransferase family protein [Levilactobacillus angrenensis]|uniref:Capsular biosynthesis protein n=1 Tax=Levilactobacillus angrenensis TaxID=2486020 RepID=A0ABW1U6L3_9LACO|nr:hypothetical protein [Levilactobacillus angrenensis]
MTPTVLVLSAAEITADMQTTFGAIYPAMIPVQDGQRLIDRLVQQYQPLGYQLFMAVSASDDSVVSYLREKCLPVTPLKIASGLPLSEAVAQALAQLQAQTTLADLTLVFGDTLIQTADRTSADTIFTHQVTDAGRWTTVTSDSQQHLQFTDKVVPSANQAQFTAVVGVFNFKAGQALAQLWQGAKSFYENLSLYAADHPLKLVDTPQWLDFGHSDKYAEAKQVEARFFNKMQIDFKRGIIRKESTDVDKFIGEVQWYLKLPKRLAYLAPRIFDYSLDEQAPFVEMEYVSYESLHNLFLYGNFELGFWREVIDELFFLRSEMTQYQVQVAPTTYQKTVTTMYLDKTVARLRRLLAEDAFYAAIADKPLIINGATYPSINAIIAALPTVLAHSGVLQGDAVGVIHGDFCLTNILYDNVKHVMRLIDPRGKFGQFDIYGDAKYDYAKLMHSFSGKYDCIIADMFRVSADTTGRLDYSLLVTGNEAAVGQLFEARLREHLGDDQVYRQIQLITSLLFLSMIPLHQDKPDRQKAMLAVGVTTFAPFMAGVTEG